MKRAKQFHSQSSFHRRQTVGLLLLATESRKDPNRLRYEALKHTKSFSSCRNLHHPGFRVGVATTFFIRA
ncbi:hypothetical protein AOLI_G00097260 [Acnodon oligacanthus]